MQQPWWVAGLVLSMCSAFIEIGALFFASLLVVGTILVSRVLFTAILATYFLNEKLNAVHWLAILLISAGCGVLLTAYYTGSNEHSIDAAAVSLGYENLTFFTGAVLLAWIMSTVRTSCSRFSIAVGASLVSTACRLERKLLAELLSDFSLGDNEWVLAMIVIVPSLISSAVYMAYLGGKALEITTTLMAMATMEAVVISLNVAASELVLDELSGYGNLQWVFTFGGILLSFVGLKVLHTQEPVVRTCTLSPFGPSTEDENGVTVTL